MSWIAHVPKSNLHRQPGQIRLEQFVDLVEDFQAKRRRRSILQVALNKMGYSSSRDSIRYAVARLLLQYVLWCAVLFPELKTTTIQALYLGTMRDVAYLSSPERGMYQLSR